MNKRKSKSVKMSKTDQEDLTFLDKLRNLFSSKKDNKYGKRSNEDLESNNITGDLQLVSTNPSPPKRKMKYNAPPPPKEIAIKTPSIIDEPSCKYTKTSVNQSDILEVETKFSKLALDDERGSQNGNPAQNKTESTSANSQLKQKENHTISLKTKQESDVRKVHNSDLNDNLNQNATEILYKVRKSIENDDNKNTTIQNLDSKKNVTVNSNELNPKKLETDEIVTKFQKISKSDEQIFEKKTLDSVQSAKISGSLKPNEVESNSVQISNKDEAHKLETEKRHVQKEDEASINENLKNKKQDDIALAKIKSVMEEVNNITLNIQKLNDPEEFFIIESGLTKAMIRLDGIQGSKNELVKQERKRGIIYIQTLLNQLDDQAKKDPR